MRQYDTYTNKHSWTTRIISQESLDNKTAQDKTIEDKTRTKKIRLKHAQKAPMMTTPNNRR